MNKFVVGAVASLIVLSACNESKSEEVSKSVEKPVVAAQPVAQVQVPVENAATVEIQSVDWDKAIEMNAAGAIYVDVREPNELEQGFAPNATNLPLSVIKDKFFDLPKDKDLLVYCRSGRRSMAASKFLLENGYTRVYNVLGGFLAYPKK
ncbi:rhodanese-like domain-containing protein [uncultured Fibrobacter sp.]|uniref:rhodanese-like domain-containing protein n=1 Tax=uncultured Fibrobacter sp. TaxID=261512 RepID=UPI002621A52F|nr:rhodanese-like domain-containing protein [uncultured Fibrobacter sp.]